MRVNIKKDERQLFIGFSGCGKTELAKHFINRVNRVVVIDPKHTFRLDGFRVRRDLPIFGKSWKMIYRPQKSVQDEDERLSGLLDELFKLKNVTIYCDELSTLADRFPLSTQNLADIARTGRERNVAVWSAVQRPRHIPKVFLTETEGMFIFSLRSQADRDYMAEYSDPLVQEPIEKYSFWYFHPDNEGIALLRYNKSKNYIEKIG